MNKKYLFFAVLLAAILVFSISIINNIKVNRILNSNNGDIVYHVLLLMDNVERLDLDRLNISIENFEGYVVSMSFTHNNTHYSFKTDAVRSKEQLMVEAYNLLNKVEAFLSEE